MKINRVKLKIILLIFIILIPLSILKIIEIRKGVELSIEAELDASQDYAEAISIAFMNFLERIWSSQYVMGNALVVEQNIESIDVKEYFSSIALGDKEFRIGYFWATPEGIITTSSEQSNLSIDIRDRYFFKEIISGEEKVIGNIERSVINGELIIPIARGIRFDGELKGIVLNTINVNAIKYIIPINRGVEGSVFGLADKNANIVYCSAKNELTTKIQIANADSPIRKALEGKIVKTYSRHSQVDEIERMGVDYPINDIGWVSFVSSPVEKVLASGKQSSKESLIVFGLIYIGSFIIAIIMSRGFIESIDKLKLAAYRVKSGELNIRTEINEDDDFGDVGQAFDNMIEALREKAKEAEEYNNLKSAFLTTISHEFKTPLNIILACIQLLENSDTEDHEEFHRLFNKYSRMQKQNSYRLLRLINNFNDITKIENNHLTIKLCNDDIVRVVEDITLSIVEYTNLKDISIIFDTDIEEKIIAFDADMIERIMLNLLSNSIKFTEKGGKIEVDVYEEENKVKISVKDNGLGVPKDKLEMIFDRFAQVDTSLRRRTEGSGIGLSLVKALVELHEGSISVQSELGKGTEFIVELPDKTVENNYIKKIEESRFDVERIHIEFSDIYI